MRRRIVFMGSDPIALPGLDFLADEALDRVEIAGVLTQPDRPAGRGRKLKANEIKQWAVARGVEVRQPERPGREEVAWLRQVGCELVLVMAYGHILRRAFLEFPPLGTYNLHASLLPGYRGASPIQSALAEGEKEMGVTLMRMVRRMDAGPIVDQEAFPVARRETGQTATAKIAAACVPLLSRNLDALLRGQVSLREQDEEAVNYTRKLEKNDGALNFSAPAATLARRINALYPWPGGFVEHREQRVKIGLADWGDEAAGGEPGTVVRADESGLEVACGSGRLSMLVLQRPGGRLLPAGEFLRGLPIPVGTRFSSSPMPSLVSERPFPFRRPRQE